MTASTCAGDLFANANEAVEARLLSAVMVDVHTTGRLHLQHKCFDSAVKGPETPLGSLKEAVDQLLTYVLSYKENDCFLDSAQQLWKREGNSLETHILLFLPPVLQFFLFNLCRYLSRV